MQNYESKIPKFCLEGYNDIFWKHIFFSVLFSFWEEWSKGEILGSQYFILFIFIFYFIIIIIFELGKMIVI